MKRWIMALGIVAILFLPLSASANNIAALQILQTQLAVLKWEFNYHQQRILVLQYQKAEIERKIVALLNKIKNEKAEEEKLRE